MGKSQGASSPLHVLQAMKAYLADNKLGKKEVLPVSIKERVRTMCQEAGRADTIVRLVCRKLEAWYLGDPDAMVSAFGDENLRTIGNKARFRNLDTVNNPADALQRLVPDFQKIGGARKMGNHLTCGCNRSHSFRIFLHAVRQHIAESSH